MKANIILRKEDLNLEFIEKLKGFLKNLTNYNLPYLMLRTLS
jgi:hypothetical protein